MAEQITETIVSDYVANILKQDGLYIGLGLGTVVGALLSARDINVALNRAKDVLTATETLTATWNNQTTNNHS